MILEERFQDNSGVTGLESITPSSTERQLPGVTPAANRPRVLVVGPGPAQVGGVTTFIRILLSSRLVTEKYELIHLNTTRAAEDIASAGRLTLRNLSYFLNQLIQLILITVRQHPVVLHLTVTSGWSFWKGSAFLLIGRLFQIHCIAHLHSGSMREYYRKRPRLVRSLIGWMLSQADVVIALSRQWQRFLLEEVRSDLNVMVIQNTVDASFAEVVMKNDHAFQRNKNIVLFVGHLNRAKGVFDILRAVPQVLAARGDTVFMFAGGAHNAQLLEEMQRWSAENNLENVVHFLGEVTGHAKLDLFLNATLFILPSYVEGMPYALLEAMAVGLPVITTPVGAIPDFVEDGQNGFLIEPGDFSALASRIIQLLEDEPLRRRMELANRQLVRDRYMPDSAMALLVFIYDQLRGLGANN